MRLTSPQNRMMYKTSSVISLCIIALLHVYCTEITCCSVADNKKGKPTNIKNSSIENSLGKYITIWMDMGKLHGLITFTCAIVLLNFANLEIWIMLMNHYESSPFFINIWLNLQFLCINGNQAISYIK